MHKIHKVILNKMVILFFSESSLLCEGAYYSLQHKAYFNSKLLIIDSSHPHFEAHA